MEVSIGTKLSEAFITRKCRELFEELARKHKDFFFQKISDRFTSGIPDFYLIWDGHCAWIELKKTGEVATKLQAYTLSRLKRAGAITLSTDNFKDVVRLINALGNSCK